MRFIGGYTLCCSNIRPKSPTIEKKTWNENEIQSKVVPVLKP